MKHLFSSYLILPFFLLFALVFKAVVIGSEASDAASIAALAALYGWCLALENKKQEPINAKVQKDLDDMRAALSALKVQRTMGR
jgi:hypothetical protein